MKVKNVVKNCIPTSLLKRIRPIYHGALAFLAHLYFGRPSNKLIVIGVTGTNGKTTTVNLIASILEAAGYKVGLSSTINFKIAGLESPNTIKMTMPSGWWLQRSLAAMVKSGCQYAVLEVSSEGLAQNRHLGINFDVAVLTNLTPEHLESHGGFENYKKAKGKLFAALTKHAVTVAKRSINSSLVKTIVVNADDEHAAYYQGFSAEKIVRFGVSAPNTSFKATDVGYSPEGIRFKINNEEFSLQLKGQFDVYNALAAVATGATQNISVVAAKQALQKIPVVPGRVEVIQRTPFMVVVDYAYEPEEMRQLYATIDRWPHQGVIQVLGPTGGGRDHARIKILGEMAASKARLVFITTDDPYDDDPLELGRQMAVGASQFGKEINQNLFIELDRRAAIRQAIRSAKPGDIILITGKGADQKMCLAGGKVIDWDDRTVAREELQGCV